MLLLRRSLIALFLLVAVVISHAQTDERSIIYDDLLAGVFPSNDSGIVQVFAFEGAAGDVIRVQAQRTGGIFMPRIRVLAPDGTAVAATTDDPLADRHLLIFQDGLPDSGRYRIEVTQQNPRADGIVTQNEYTLLIEQRGSTFDVDAARAAIPVIAPDPLPQYFLSPVDTDSLPDLALSGVNLSEQIEIETLASRFRLVGTGAASVIIDNTNTISRVISRIGISQNGIALESVSGALFVTDSNISLLSIDNSVVTIELASGVTIRTDFYGTPLIYNQGNQTDIRTPDGQRLLLTGQQINLTRRGGLNGEGPNREPIVVLEVDDASLETDITGWDVLALRQDEVTIVYDSGWQFTADQPAGQYLLTGNTVRPDLNDDGLNTQVALIDITQADGSTLPLAIDPVGLATVDIQNQAMVVLYENGERIVGDTTALIAVRTENETTQLSQADGAFVTILPDGTRIHTARERNRIAGALPVDESFLPQNFNNTGTTVSDYQPQVDFDFVLSPVNRVNGNFVYAVQDDRLPSHAPELRWQRTYNSMAMDNQTPDYLRDHDTYGVVGNHWRHSYQIELDVRQSPYGELTVILEDGSQHIFSRSGAEQVYRSGSLLSWTITRELSIAGNWIAYTAGGMQYHFDAAGRLRRLENAQGQRILIAPMPAAYYQAMGASGGFFIVEDYGRRYEVYTDETDTITAIRNPQGRLIPYTHDDDYLIEVDYPGVDYAASYTYDDQYLTGLDDVNSPHAQQMSLTYDNDGRVTAFTGYPAAELPQRITLTYEDGRTVQNWSVDGVPQTDSDNPADFEREMVWTYDNRFRLTGWILPDNDWSYQWRYAAATDRITEISLPTRAVLRFTYDERGYLTRFTDPVFGQAGSYVLRYQTDDVTLTRLLTAIDAPNIENWRQYSYDSQLRLQSTTEAVAASVTRTTTYDYDDTHALHAITELDATGELSVTRILRDAFGYPAQITSGALDEEPVHVHQMVYDAFGRLQQMRDPSERVTTLQWQPDRNLIQSVTIDSDVYQYAYDEHDNLTSYLSPRVDERYVYDGAGRVINSTDAAGRQTSYAYDSDSNLLGIVYPQGGTQSFRYNALNQPVRFTDFGGVTTGYDVTLDSTANRVVHTITGALDQQMQVRFDPLGRLRQIEELDRSGNSTYRYVITYDATGNPLEIADTRGRISLSYNRAGQIISSTLNESTQTQYQYNPAGVLSSVITPSGVETTYTYDVTGNPVEAVQTANGESLPVAGYAYDADGNLTRHTQDGRTVATYTYGERGLLTSSRDAADNTTMYSYDAAGNLTAVTGADDATLTYAYDTVNRLTEFVGASGQTTRYAYDDLDNLITLTDPSGLVTMYAYSAANELIAISQPEDREILYGRDGVGRIVSETNPLGQTTVYSYNVIGEPGRIINPRGLVESFGWYSDGTLSRYNTSSGATFEYIPDAIGRLTGIIDLGTEQASAVNTRLTYDAAGYITAINQGSPTVINTDDGRNYRYQRDAFGRIIAFTAPGTDEPYEFVYDVRGQLSRMIAPDGKVTAYTYDDIGQVTTVIEQVGTPDETSTDYSYDIAGNIARVATDDGIIREYQYDASGQLIAYQESGGDVSRSLGFEYDAAGRLTAHSDGGQRVVYTYDLFDNLVSVQQIGASDDDTLTTRYSYDAIDNLIAITLPQGEIITQTFDGIGQRVRYIDAANSTWSYSYDDAGNITQISNPAGNNQSYGYDASGRLQTITYENGGTVTLNYDALGNIARVILPETDVSGEVVRYRFDAANRLLAYGDADTLTTITRNQNGQIQSIITGAGDTITLTYDARGRLLDVTTPERTISRTYDENSERLIRMTDNTTAIEMAYDGIGQLTDYSRGDLSETDEGVEYAPSLISSYAYDRSGNITTRNNDITGTMTYAYDAFQRPVTITHDDHAVDLTYNQNGWRTQITRNNGVETRYSYDANGRIRNVIHTGAEGNRLDGFAYEYDAAGNIIRMTRANNWAILYSYDAARQLTSERWLDPTNQIVYSVTYTYDAAGNRIEQATRINQGSETRTVFTYNNRNQLVTELRDADINLDTQFFSLPVTLVLLISAPLMIVLRKRRRLMIIVALIVLPVMVVAAWQFDDAPTVSYTYDEDGNLIEEVFADDGRIVYRYDSFHRLTQIEAFNDDDFSIGLNRIGYDLLGRVETVNTGETIHTLLYDAAGLIGVRDDNSGEVTANISPNGRDTLLLTGNEGDIWLLDDGIGQLQFATGNGDDEPGGFARNAFGELIFPDNLALEDDRFIEKIYLPDAGIMLMGMRAYHTRSGRFLQRDSVRHDPRNNLYTFAYNSPTNYTDPTGMTPEGATDAAQTTIPQVDPLELIITPDIPSMLNTSVTTVAQRQADETARVLSLASTLQFDINETVFYPANQGCDVFMRFVNPLPDALTRDLQSERQQMLDLYDSASGWMPSSQPVHNHIPDPASALSQVDRVIAATMRGVMPLQGCETTLSLPARPQPQAIEFYDRLARLRSQLDETPYYDAAIADLHRLTAPLDDAPLQPLITTQRMRPEVVPVPDSPLLMLREQTQQMITTIVMPQPLEMPVVWQQLYQARDVAPASIIELNHR